MKDIDEMKSRRAVGHIACFAAYAIFGVNIITCKDLTAGQVITPLGIFSLRALGAGSIFWLLSVILPSARKEKVALRDLPLILLASFLGFFITQMTFLMAIPQVTPMTCSIISSLSPVYTMFIAAVAIKEPVTLKKAAGVAVSFIGIILLIINSVHGSGASESTPWGIVLLFANGLSFSLYLGIFKPLISRYSVISFMKWIFLFAALMSLPFSARELICLDWASIPRISYAELAFLIIFATFISYFLIPIGQKALRPTLVSMYSYVQPIIATLISICIGMDMLSWQKILSAILVFAGVIIVSRSKTRAELPK